MKRSFIDLPVLNVLGGVAEADVKTLDGLFAAVPPPSSARSTARACCSRLLPASPSGVASEPDY